MCSLLPVSSNSRLPGQPLYVPAGAKFPLDDLAYLGIVLSRFWQDDHSNLMRCVNRHRNLTRAKISGPLPPRSMVAISARLDRAEGRYGICR